MDRIELLKADITTLRVDAIVNAANNTLSGGGGVDGAIHCAAGGELLEACRNLKGCKTGFAKITKGYKLPAKFVIHTVGPVWTGGQNNEAGLLASCYRESLRIAVESKCRTIAFPAISCGVYRFPIPLACEISVMAVGKFLNKNDFIEKITLVSFGSKVEEALLGAYEFFWRGKTL